jgi:hypothetical protein
MPNYDQFKDKLKSTYRRLPVSKIEAWIKKNFRDEFKTRKNGTEYIICNPFNGDTGFHFNINPEKNKCHDWRGNEWAGPINPATNSRNCSFVKFVRLFKKCSYSEAIKDIMGEEVDIREYLKPESRITDTDSQLYFNVELPKGTEPLVLHKSDMQAKILIKWLKSRGYTDQTIEKSDLRFMGMDVYWPYFEFDTLVYWQSRSRLNKVFNFPSLDVYENNKLIGHLKATKGDYFYGFDDVDQASYLIITEAIFDKNTIGQQALASGGAVLTPTQVKKLKLLSPIKGIILSPDADEAGLTSIISNAELLERAGYKLYYSIPPDMKYKNENEIEVSVKDWNELGQFVVGFDDVRKHHDKQIKPLNTQAKIDIQLRVAEMKERKRRQAIPKSF